MGQRLKLGFLSLCVVINACASNVDDVAVDEPLSVAENAQVVEPGVESAPQLATAPEVSPALAPDEITKVLQLHNKARCQVYPFAQTMRALKWDTAMETMVQNFINTCPNGHGPPDGLQQYRNNGGNPAYWWLGQNMGWGYGSMESVIWDGWVGERANYTYGVFPNTCKAGAICGHYTQVIWSETEVIGCAKNTVSCPSWGNKYYVCNYGLGGNIVGVPTYQVSPSYRQTDACTAAGCFANNHALAAKATCPNATAGFPPSNANDDKPSTYFKQRDATQSYLTLSFPAAIRFHEVEVEFCPGTPPPKTFALQLKRTTAPTVYVVIKKVTGNTQRTVNLSRQQAYNDVNTVRLKFFDGEPVACVSEFRVKYLPCSVDN